MLRINARIQNIGSKNSTFLIFALKDNDIGPALKKANWLVRLYARHLYKQLNGSTQNANKRLKKILGDTQRSIKRFRNFRNQVLRYQPIICLRGLLSY